MSHQRQLRDLLQESYSRLNDLNGLVNRRHMVETLQRNSFKTKIKARSIIANLHQLLDAFYVHVLKTIDSNVVDTSDTLKQHSSEIENYVTYMAELCLIGEKFLKEDNAKEEEDIEIREKLIDCLSDSDVMKNVDYKACVSVDLDVDMEALLALPLVHLVRHSSDNTKVTKLCSLSLDDLRQQAYDSAQPKEQVHGSASKSTASKPTLPSPIEMSVKSNDLHQRKVAGPVLRMCQEKTLSKLPLDIVHENDSSKTSELSEISAKSMSVSEEASANIPSYGNFEIRTPWREKEKKNLTLSVPGTYWQGFSQESSRRLERRKQDGIRFDSSDETVIVSHDDLHESGYETPSRPSSQEARELPCMEQSVKVKPGLDLFAKDFHPREFVPSKMAYSVQQKMDPRNAACHNFDQKLFHPVENVSSAIQVTCSGENIVDRNLTLLQSCFKNAQRQSWTLQSFPHKHA